MSNPPVITLEWVRQEKARHKQALADLDAAERLLLAAAVSSGSTGPPPREKDLVALYGGKRRALLAIIAEAPDGLTTPETIKKAIENGIMDMSTANVSPKLSESRKAEYLELLEGGRWKITEKGREFIAAKKT